MRGSFKVLMVLGLTAVAMLAAAPAGAHEEGDDDAPEPIYPLVFPVIGDVTFTDTHDAPRGGGRLHHAQDLMGEKGQPVVAAADGVVDWMSDTCCALQIVHDDGWSTWYIHLDNDTPGTDDGQGWGIAPGIESGVRVVAGQLIGWVGDSGNAEWTAPHLHFELRDPDGVAHNVFHDLEQATVIDAPIAGWEGHFWDDDGSVHEQNIDVMFEEGITKGCNPPRNDAYCPYDNLTRGQVAAFLRRHLELPAVDESFFVDDDASIFAEDIDALTAAGIGFGCTETEFCPDVDLTRAEMAELLVRAFEYPPAEQDFFTDDDGGPFEPSINALFAAGITVGCNPPDNDHYCPDEPLMRAQMATFLARALGYEPVD